MNHAAQDFAETERVPCYECNKMIEADADTTHWDESCDFAWCQDCVDAESLRVRNLGPIGLAVEIRLAQQAQEPLREDIAERIIEFLTGQAATTRTRRKRTSEEVNRLRAEVWRHHTLGTPPKDSAELLGISQTYVLELLRKETRRQAALSLKREIARAND